MFDSLDSNKLWTDLNHLPPKFQDADIAELQAFQCVKEDLNVTTQENVILHGSLIVVPTALCERAIAHEGHQGLVKARQLLCEKVWFPKNDEYVKHKIGLPSKQW